MRASVDIEVPQNTQIEFRFENIAQFENFYILDKNCVLKFKPY